MRFKVGKYRIVGVKYNPITSRIERVTLYRNKFDGDSNSACSAKFNMMRLGYVVEINPTPGVWTETLELDR